jgi:peptidoglycan/xylan/chitin deacetylase (PgdA/CDA1 family)
MTVPPIVCYHKVDTRFELGFTQLEPRVFRRQVETLARLGWRSLGSADLAAALVDPPHLTPRPTHLVLTFDDAYASLAEHAFPVLADLGLRALVFVITDYAGRENTWDVQYGWRRFRHLSWDQLGTWQERGIEVHAHGATHARLTWLGDREAADELGRAREAIRANLGTAPAGIGYPFGAVDERVRALAVQAGYSLGFAGPAPQPPDPMRLPRLPVYQWDRAGIPFVLRSGGLGPLARGAARLTNRIAVGTAVFQKVLGSRYR